MKFFANCLSFLQKDLQCEFFHYLLLPIEVQSLDIPQRTLHIFYLVILRDSASVEIFQYLQIQISPLFTFYNIMFSTQSNNQQCDLEIQLLAIQINQHQIYQQQQELDQYRQQWEKQKYKRYKQSIKTIKRAINQSLPAGSIIASASILATRSLLMGSILGMGGTILWNKWFTSKMTFVQQ